MKRFLYLSVILLLLLQASVIEGQNKYYRRTEPKFGYGAKAGVNISSQSTPNDDSGYEINNLIRFNAGGYCNYYFLKFLAVQPELIISGKGVHWKDHYDDMKDILTYLDIPVLLRYQPVKYLNIQAGPQVGLRLRAMQKDMETGTKTNINDYYNFFDYGLVIGIEGNLPNNINLTARYVFGLSSATNDMEYIDPWYNNFLELSIGFRLKGK